MGPYIGLKEYKHTNQGNPIPGNGQEIILNSIEEAETRGGYIISFYDPDIGRKGAWVRYSVTVQEVYQNKEYSLKEGAMGDRLYELAFLKFMTEKLKGDPNRPYQTRFRNRPDGRVESSPLAHGGQPHRALFYMVGPEFEKAVVGLNEHGKDKMNEALNQIQADCSNPNVPNELMVTASTLSEEEAEKRGGSWNEHLVANHAYRLVSVSDEYVFLSNPHKGDKVFNIPREMFLRDFSRLYTVRRAANPSMASPLTMRGVISGSTNYQALDDPDIESAA
ncbi:hypothetical protein IPJ72_06255 [Candidatus Peregrinibacteria bacterium]|nr:MAG: hypothetical protein IPJ72_06255 [Candidatus Peregrinibacteria bacterium]